MVTRLPNRASVGRIPVQHTRAEHDQVVGKIIEFQRFDVGQRRSLHEPWDIGNRGTRTEVQINMITGKDLDAAVLCPHFDRLGRNEAASPIDPDCAGRDAKLGAAVKQRRTCAL